MPHDRVRPSLLAIVGPSAIHAMACAASMIGKETALIQGLEKGVQDEHDEQLRLLNAEQVSDAQLRQSSVEMRDRSYDLFNESQKSIVSE